MEELDRKNIISHETKVENEASSNFTTTSTMKNMFPHGMEQELESFNWKVGRLIKFNRGIDRPKSYNPWMDNLENNARLREQLARADARTQLEQKVIEEKVQFWPDQEKINNKVKIVATEKEKKIAKKWKKKMMKLLGLKEPKKQSTFITWWKAWMKQLTTK